MFSSRFVIAFCGVGAAMSSSALAEAVEQPAPAVHAAADAAEAAPSENIEDIIVTARRMAERLQDVPSPSPP